jgi:hypothetical protein
LNKGLVVQRVSLHSDWKSLPLWDHQIRAIELVENYLEARSSGAALIRMPMGTKFRGQTELALCVPTLRIESGWQRERRR